MALRTLISRSSSSFASLSPLNAARAFTSGCSPPFVARAAPLLRLRPLVSAVGTGWPPAELSRGGATAARCFSTRPTTSSLNDPSPNWSNRPPKETILLDGCDFEHWLVVLEPPEEGVTRDEIIDSYVKTLAQVVGSEEEARMKIYSVSTKHYFAFGALVSEELSYKIKALPRVRWVLPDSYLDVKNKDYGGEPFIDGKAVPYDPKYHEEWVRNNARANERSRRNDRPRNFDRSRNFERRRENMQNRDFQNRFGSPMPNQQFQSSEAQNPLPPRDMPPGPGAHGTMPPPPLGPGTMPPPPLGNMPSGSAGMAGNVPPNVQYSNRDAGPSFQGTPYQNQGPSYQGNYVPSRDGGHMPGTNAYQNVHQGGGGPYQGSTGASQGVGNNAYQGGGGSFQGSGTAYQGGGGAGYSGSGDAYQGGGGPYQGSGNAYQGGGGPYQGSGNAYQGGGYPAGGSASQGGGGGGGYPAGGSASQGGGSSIQSGGNPYQGRDMPGRD